MSAASTTSTSTVFRFPTSTAALSSEYRSLLEVALRLGYRRRASGESIMTTREDAAVPTLTGACMCRAVQYEVPDRFGYALNCHCSNCRRTTGAAFKSFAGIARDQLLITRGGENLLIVGDADHDAHCKTCGSLLYSVVRD